MLAPGSGSTGTGTSSTSTSERLLSESRCSKPNQRPAGEIYGTTMEPIEDDYHHGEGFSEHMLSPWEDRHFWETTARVANNNHFYQTSSSFDTESSTEDSVASVQTDADDRIDGHHGIQRDDETSDGEKGKVDYQVMVERVVDEDGSASYQVKTKEENMDENVWRTMMFPNSDDADNANDRKDVNEPIFKTSYEARYPSEAPPPLALSASSSSEASTELVYLAQKDQVVDQDSKTLQMHSTRRRMVAPCIFLALLLFYVGYILLISPHINGMKLTGTIAHDPQIQDTSEHDAFVNVISEYTTASGSDHASLMDKLVSFFKALTNVDLWRDHATEIVSGALQTSLVKW